VQGLTFSKKLTVFVSPASSCEASPTLSPISTSPDGPATDGAPVIVKNSKGRPANKNKKAAGGAATKRRADPTDGEGGSKPKKVRTEAAEKSMTAVPVRTTRSRAQPTAAEEEKKEKGMKIGNWWYPYVRISLS
jgi:hypothetical protein